MNYDSFGHGLIKLEMHLILPFLIIGVVLTAAAMLFRAKGKIGTANSFLMVLSFAETISSIRILFLPKTDFTLDVIFAYLSAVASILALGFSLHAARDDLLNKKNSMWFYLSIVFSLIPIASLATLYFSDASQLKTSS